jgi:hypothetical protein
MAQTAIPSAASPVGTFLVGRVLSHTFSLFFRTVAKFFVVAAVAALPTIAFYGGESGAAARDPDKAVAMIVTIVVALIAWFLLSSLSQAAILYGAFQEMRRRPVSLGESLAKGLSRIFPLLGLSICVAFGLIVGFILLIVPGYIFWVMWYVATPACVVERLGPFKSMSRSRELTKGHRWKIFGIILLVGIVSGIAGAIIEKVLELALSATPGNVGVMVGLLIWNALAGLFGAILVTVMYHDLRVAKEGVDVEQIASVFD